MKLYILHEWELMKRASQATCPYCHDKVSEVSPEREASSTWSCPKCGVVHHRECLGSSGKCATLGCNGKVSPIKYGVNPLSVARAKELIEAGVDADKICKLWGKAAYVDALQALG